MKNFDVCVLFFKTDTVGLSFMTCITYICI